MKKLSLQFCFLLLLGLVSFSSCLKDDYDGPHNNMPSAGLMYFVNSYTDTESELLFSLDGNVITNNPLNGAPMVLAYQTFSGARWLHPGDRELTIARANMDQEVLIDTTLTVEVDSGYTSFIYGTKEQPKFAMTHDRTIDDLATGESGIRFMNLAAGVEKVSLYIDGEEEPLYSNRPTETGASAVAHEAFQAQKDGVYTFVVTDAEGNELVSRKYRKENGMGILRGYYTIMLVGNADDENTPLYIGIVEHR